MTDTYVYVLDQNNRPLMPTKRYGWVRRNLKSGRATVAKKKPFTIRLTYETATHTQPVTVGIDPGRTNIGISAVAPDDRCLYAAHCATRNKAVPRLMMERRMHRQASRRGERLARKRLARKHGTVSLTLNGRKLPGCEEFSAVKDIINTEARFNNRRRPEGWLTPTANQLLRTHISLLKQTTGLLPVTDVVIELNKFAFMQLDHPGVRKCDIDFQHGALFGKDGVKAAVSEMQDGRCLLCRKGIEHYHHVVPRSRGGSNTMDNIAGLCFGCHDMVHKDTATEEKLLKKKQGLNKKYGALSVLNQILPYFMDACADMYPSHVTATTGWNTKQFRDANGIAKDHDTDAYCIACSVLEGQAIVDVPDVCYEIRQFRRHDRAVVRCQRERTYMVGKTKVATNRRKRTDQKTDSLADWFEDMVLQHGLSKAETMRSRLSVTKSTRYYNREDRIFPGAVFLYAGREYVLQGQLSKGAYFRAVGKGTINYPAEKCQVVAQNAGLVYI
ncbi:MAG: RRXRR domain-containing protein [Agathobacter sp.]